MNKKILIGGVLGSLLLFSSLEAVDLSSVKEMSGKQGDACGALLCLSGGMSSGACAPYIAKYFAIQLSKPWKTAQARKNFLNLCPVASENGNTDPELAKLQNDILPYVSGGCTKEELNANIEKTRKPLYYLDETQGFSTKRPVYGYRVNPLPTQNCSLLMKSPYFPQKISYTCSKEFYDEKIWNDGFTKQYISESEYQGLSDDLRGTETKRVKISKNEYLSLPNDKRDRDRIPNAGGDKDVYNYYKLEPAFYKKNFIKKDCWLVEDKEVVIN